MNRLKKIIAISFIFTLSIFSALAKKANYYISLAQSGPIKDIEREIAGNPGLVNQTFESNKETFLMLALRYDRELPIIELLVKNGSNLNAKSKNKRTPVMYASQFCSKADVMDYICTAGASTRKSRQSRLFAVDAEGNTAFDFGRKNPQSDIILQVMEKYA